MKKTYINPNIEVVKIQTQQMLAGSPVVTMHGGDATSAGLGRDNDGDDW